MAAVGVPLTSDSNSSPLLETTCVIVPPIFFQRHDEKQPSFISALELVSQAGFEIQGLHMVLFSEQRARALCCCFSVEYKVIDDHGGSSLLKMLPKVCFPDIEFQALPGRVRVGVAVPFRLALL